MRLLFIAFVMVMPVEAQTGSNPNSGTEPLKLLLSIEQQSIPAPFPARVRLHFHNSGREPLWLYRHVRPQAQEGSTLAIHLEPLEGPPAREISAQANVFESAGLPHPKLVRLEPDGDGVEKTTIRILPAMVKAGGAEKPVWGRYRLSVTYAAKFTAAEHIQRNLGLVVWQGEVTSNTIELELRPPSPSEQASVAGVVVDSVGRPIPRAVVTLSDHEEHLVDQTPADLEGRFSFRHLPLGLYWVTARRADSNQDTVSYRHVQSDAAQPNATLEIPILPEEIYEAKKILHKPVLFRIIDPSGQPARNVTLELTWSNGPLLDSVTGQAYDDGSLAVELIPGRNFATLKRSKCDRQEERVDVAEGPGIDGFKLTYTCKSGGD